MRRFASLAFALLASIPLVAAAAPKTAGSDSNALPWRLILIGTLLF